MDIANALRRAGRDDITIRSVIANTVQNIYSETSWKDIIVQSVQIKWKKIIIKTGIPLVNWELTLMQNDIKKTSLEKLLGMNIKLSSDIVLRFV